MCVKKKRRLGIVMGILGYISEVDIEMTEMGLGMRSPVWGVGLAWMGMS